MSEELLSAIDDMEYTQMTQIQQEAIPLVLEGRDVIGRSSTGTGKTAAFGVPTVEMIWEQPTNKPLALILAPTRELAVQISEELGKYAKYKDNISIATVYGGQSMENQIRQLKSANIVVGTPGRIMDHMRRRTLKLEKIRIVVLDEADEMLNMGFYDDMKLILSEVPQQRQTLLFSATMPPAIMKITEEFQDDPELVAVDGEQRTVETIAQYSYQVPQGKKIDALELLLLVHKPNRAIIFCNTKRMVDELVDRLNEDGYKAVGLHGDMSQNVRNKVMQDYKSGRLQILVATDVAARGIDVTDIEAVYNYDIPLETEYYIHRIGRTGRAGKEGAAHTLVANRLQARKMEEIQRYIGAQVENASLPSAEEITKRHEEAFAQRVLAAAADNRYGKFLPLVDDIAAQDADYRTIAAALAGMLAEKDKTILPKVKNVEVAPQPKERKSAPSRRNEITGKMAHLFVGIGRNQDAAPNFIVGAVADATGLSSKVMGKIDIYEDFTTIEMNVSDAHLAAERMQNAKIRGRKVAVRCMEEGEVAGLRKIDKNASRGGKRYVRKERGADERRSRNNASRKDDFRAARKPRKSRRISN